VARIRRAVSGDLDDLLIRERLEANDLASIVGLGRVLIAYGDDGGLIGWLRWGMFWDEVPFMNRTWMSYIVCTGSDGCWSMSGRCCAVTRARQW
jgi:hypothetical protein